jgi:hypothetical protein
LKASGLWKRECWYLDTIHPTHDVLPESPSRLKWACVPPGWKRVPATSCRFTGSVHFHADSTLLRELPFFEEFGTKRRVPANVAELQDAFWRDVAARTWNEQPTRGELLETYKRNVLGSGWEYAWRDWKKPVVGRLRRLFASRRRVNQRPAKEWVPARRESLVWVPFDEDKEEVVWTGATVAELFEYERELGLTFEPPVDYTVGDHFGA